MSRELSRMGRFLRGVGAYLLAALAALALSAITGTEDATWFWGLVAVPLAVVIYRRMQ